jgi:hypothetical protein
VPAPTLERTTPKRGPVAVGSAQDILARLERYAAVHRSAAPPPDLVIEPTLLPTRARHAAGIRHGIDAATIDLFPYDLAAAIVGAAATILAGIAFARPLAFVCAAGLLASGEWARRHRWFPSVATNLLIGTVVGLVLVVFS